MAELFGKVPPNNKDAEQALLGSILIRNNALEEVQYILDKNDFYVISNQNIWDAIIKLKNKSPGINVDIVTLTDFLAELGTLEICGGVNYIASLTNSVLCSNYKK